MLNKSTKAVGCSTKGYTDFFNIVTGFLQGDTLQSFLYMICQNSTDIMKETVFFHYLKGTETITGSDCRYNLILLANTSA